MRLSIKTKQVAGVTALVGLAVAVMSGWYLTLLVQVLFAESHARAEMLVKTAYQRAFGVLAALPAGEDPSLGLRNDPGLRAILESNVYSKDLLYAAIVDPAGVIVAHDTVTRIGQALPPAGDLSALVDTGSIVETFRTMYTPGALEVRQPLLFGTEDLGSIRVGVSTLLLRGVFEEQGRTVLLTDLAILLGASLLAMLLAQIVLRPIHVIRGGLARLGRGEVDVNVELPADRDLGDLGDSFKQVTARLAAGRSELAGQKATLESVVDRLEDAVALFAPDGTLLFANPAMRPALGGATGALHTLLPAEHPYRAAVEAAYARREPAAGDVSPAAVDVPGIGERLILARAVADAEGRTIAVMLVARNLEYLTEVESTLSYSRKIAALSRLTAGIAHEIKNPLNATMIHLELLKMKVSAAPDALEHVSVIASQVRRLDEVVQGLLKFTRPEDLRLEPVYLAQLVDDLMPVVQAEAAASGVDVKVDVPENLPPAQADPRLLSQALLNLALNACQAMPTGGRLRIAARARPGRWLEIEFEDTGVGIAAEDLPRIFDLYFTRRPQGSGIGLSLVYRTVQLHDGDIEVQSVPGRGTTFRVQLRQARTILAPAMAAPAS